MPEAQLGVWLTGRTRAVRSIAAVPLADCTVLVTGGDDDRLAAFHARPTCDVVTYAHLIGTMGREL
jgi:hypothetical protein